MDSQTLGKNDQRASALAHDHYERIAHTSGILAWLLRDYLNSRYNHLLLIYEDAAALQGRLETIANEAANDSFFYLCQVLHLLDTFQNKANSAYLLRGEGANEALRRLCNVFLVSLPQGTSSDAIDVHGIFSSLAASKFSSMSSHDFRAEQHAPLAKQFRAYKNWLLEASPQVTTAAGALIEYHELLMRELASMREQRSNERAFGRPVGRAPQELWLAQPRAAALEAAVNEGALPHPLGRGQPADHVPPPASPMQVAPSAEVAPAPRDPVKKKKLRRRSYSITMNEGSVLNVLDRGVQVSGDVGGDLVGNKAVAGDDVRGDKIARDKAMGATAPGDD